MPCFGTLKLPLQTNHNSTDLEFRFRFGLSTSLQGDWLVGWMFKSTNGELNLNRNEININEVHVS